MQYPVGRGQRRHPPQPVGLLGTDPSFDEARQAFARAAVHLAELAAVEMALYRLISEQRKAQKRVNALKYNIIPSYKPEVIKHASPRHLEEEERGTLFQIKLGIKYLGFTVCL
jgi:V/A-type H+-transporting ATPase subunit D